MKVVYIIGFTLILCFDTLAQVGFKFTAINTEPPMLEVSWLWKVLQQGWIYAALGGYIGSFFTYMTMLETAPIGAAFAATHLEIVTVGFASYCIWKDAITIPQLIGGALIIAGIFMLATDEEEKEKQHQAEAESKVESKTDAS
ncbi:MAG TPA: EamA family transporter [Oculatellaceae cyanobacterium]